MNILEVSKVQWLLPADQKFVDLREFIYLIFSNLTKLYVAS